MQITLATLPQATEQQVFDYVATHLLKQGAKSRGIVKQLNLANGAAENVIGCKYRSGKLSCAAGCLIGKGEYKRSFESVNWGALAHQGKVPKEHYLLIGKLQSVHDNYDPDKWEKALDQLALEQDLTFNLAQYKAA